MIFSDIQNITIPEGDVQRIYDSQYTLWEKGGGKDTYTLVEYIQGTGTQYINTGWLPTPYEKNYSYTFNMEMSIERSVTYNYIMGSSYNMRMYLSNMQQLLIRYNYGSWNPLTFRPTIGTKFSWSITGSLFRSSLSGNVNLNHRNYGEPAGNSLTLFYDSISNNYCYGKIYSFDVYDTSISNYVLYLRPAIRDSDQEVGMYDQINDVFYANAGSGSFIAGNPI